MAASHTAWLFVKITRKCVHYFLVPGKQELLDFLRRHPDIPHTSQLLYTKVFNEQKTAKIRSAKRQLQMNDY